MADSGNMLFTKEHEWLRREGSRCYVGISDYAQRELGDVVFVDLPAVGATVEKGKAFAVVESVKEASDIYAPASGKVVEVNQKLTSNPELLNSSPFSEGWIAVLEAASDADETLLSQSAYDDYVKTISK
jgi:glycine cleavage system H protein